MICLLKLNLTETLFAVYIGVFYLVEKGKYSKFLLSSLGSHSVVQGSNLDETR